MATAASPSSARGSGPFAAAVIVEAVVADGDDRSARALAGVIGRLISSNTISDGSRMPTVRDLARRLGVSPTTVSEAWRSLADVGAIDARGRNGTFARRPTGRGRPRRYGRVTDSTSQFELDLSTGTPDPALLPDLGPVIAAVSRQSLTSSYLDHPVLPELEELLVESWPFRPEAITVVDGAMDALDRVLQQVVRLGDRVVVEHPAFPPILDLLEQLGCETIPVDVDRHGLDPAGLAIALEAEPSAVLLQPRAHNPTGVAIPSTRARALAKALESHDAMVIEDDHANEISAAPLVSLGRWLPERTVHIRSFSKSHGPDLRLAAIGGAGDVVSAVENRRLLGPGWSSRILQAVLLQLLRDPAVDDVMASARDTYARRRAAISEVLTAHQVTHPTGDGINLWMEVGDERTALVRLAACGIGAAPGEPFLARPDADHLRVTVGLVPDVDTERVAELLVDAAGRLPSTIGRRR